MTAKPTAFSNAGAASKYPWGREDYYFKGQEQSFWFGRGAEALGLYGDVDQKHHQLLCHGKIPIFGVKNADTKFPLTHHQPNPLNAWQRPGDGLRRLRECSLVSLGERERPGFLQDHALSDRQTFDAMRWPRVTADGERIIDHVESIHRGGKSQRPGVDFTFSGPKSIAVLVAKVGHKSDLGSSLIAAHDTAVKEALSFLEERASARMTESGVTRKTLTENIVVSAFNHGTSRPVTLQQVEGLGADFADIAQWMRDTNRKTLTDTQIHTHAFVMNMTQCEDGQWRALDNKFLFDDQKLAEAIYHAALARDVKSLGLETRQTKTNFELACVPDEIIKRESLRTALIDQALEKKGLTRETAKKGEIDRAVKNTRNDKAIGAEGNDLRTEMIERIALDEAKAGVTIDPHAPVHVPVDIAIAKTAQEGIESALRHTMERSSVVAADDVIRAALEAGAGNYGYQEILAEFDAMAARGELKLGRMVEDPTATGPGHTEKRKAFAEAEASEKMLALAQSIAEKKEIDPPATKAFTEVRLWLDEHAPRKLGLKDESEAGLVPNRPAATGEMVITTQAAQDRETAMLESVKSGRGQMRPVMTAVEAVQVLDQKTADMKRQAAEKAAAEGKSPTQAADRAGMNAGQRAAAELILTSRDRVSVITGTAGAGKSFMLGTVKPLIEAAGLTLHGVAPSHQAKNELMDVTGSGDTLQAFLMNKKIWESYGEKHIVIVDEAGMASTKQMAELERISKMQGFRYVLVGDPKQIAAVDAGKPLDQIISVTDIGAARAHMPVSVRHKNAELAAAAHLASQGKFAEALEKTSVRTIADPAERRQYIARRYIEVVNGAGAAARQAGKTEPDIAAAITRAQRETLLLANTNAARKEINGYVREEIGLAGQGETIDTLSPKNTTAESRRFVKTYETGDILQFSAAYKSLGIDVNDRATVVAVHPDRVVIETANGQTRDFVPARYQSEQWNVYDAERIELAAGDRVRMRESTKDAFVNGDWGVVEKNHGGVVEIRSERDPGTTWRIDTTDRALAVDYGYCMTAHGAQGASKDLTIAELDTNSRTLSAETSFVSMTRSRHTLEIVTNDGDKLNEVIGREAYKPNALDFGRMTTPPEPEPEIER